MKKIIIFCALTVSLYAGQHQVLLTKRHKRSVTKRFNEILEIPVQSQTNSAGVRQDAGKIITKIQNGGYPDSVKRWLRTLLDLRIMGINTVAIPPRFFPINGEKYESDMPIS